MMRMPSPCEKGEGSHGWRWNSRTPSDPPGYWKRHGSKDTRLKLGNLWCPVPGGRDKDPSTKNISRREGARVSDEAIVSDDATGQNNPTPSQGPLDRRVWKDDASTQADCC